MIKVAIERGMTIIVKNRTNDKQIPFTVWVPLNGPTLGYTGEVADGTEFFVLARPRKVSGLSGKVVELENNGVEYMTYLQCVRNDAEVS